MDPVEDIAGLGRQLGIPVGQGGRVGGSGSHVEGLGGSCQDERGSCEDKGGSCRDDMGLRCCLGACGCLPGRIPYRLCRQGKYLLHMPILISILKIGLNLEPFDFRLEGVTSISAGLE